MRAAERPDLDEAQLKGLILIRAQLECLIRMRAQLKGLILIRAQPECLIRMRAAGRPNSDEGSWKV